MEHETRYKLTMSAWPETARELCDLWAAQKEYNTIAHTAFEVTIEGEHAPREKPYNHLVTGSREDVIDVVAKMLEIMAKNSVDDVNEAQVLRVIRASRSGC